MAREFYKGDLRTEDIDRHHHRIYIQLKPLCYGLGWRHRSTHGHPKMEPFSRLAAPWKFPQMFRANYHILVFRFETCIYLSGTYYNKTALKLYSREMFSLKFYKISLNDIIEKKKNYSSWRLRCSEALGGD